MKLKIKNEVKSSQTNLSLKFVLLLSFTIKFEIN